jgi:hypothetical protein
MYRIIALTGLLLISTNLLAQEKNKLYFAFGSHRIFYTHSDIHLKRAGPPYFDFTLHNVIGKDEGGLKFETAPQFSYTVGYYFAKKKFGIEYQYDHIKYFVKQDQRVRLTGVIENEHYDQDTTINPSFVQLEHSDGGNYAMLNFVKWIALKPGKYKNPPEFICKIGFGLVNPKTNSSILGYWRDDKYHISGFVTGIETGLRIHFGKYIFATGTFKGAYANYSDFLIAGGKGSQKWFSAQFNYLVGTQFPL